MKFTIEIETKFNVGDKVYCMAGGLGHKIVHKTIKSIEVGALRKIVIDENGESTPDILYKFEDPESKFTGTYEKGVFETKDELVEWLCREYPK